MITPTEDIPEFCLDTDVPLTHFQGEHVRPNLFKCIKLFNVLSTVVWLLPFTTGLN
jgi:hypothetical protein